MRAPQGLSAGSQSEGVADGERALGEGVGDEERRQHVRWSSIRSERWNGYRQTVAAQLEANVMVSRGPGRAGGSIPKVTREPEDGDIHKRQNRCGEIVLLMLPAVQERSRVGHSACKGHD